MPVSFFRAISQACHAYTFGNFTNCHTILRTTYPGPSILIIAQTRNVALLWFCFLFFRIFHGVLMRKFSFYLEVYFRVLILLLVYFLGLNICRQLMIEILISLYSKMNVFERVRKLYKDWTRYR